MKQWILKICVKLFNDFCTSFIILITFFLARWTFTALHKHMPHVSCVSQKAEV